MYTLCFRKKKNILEINVLLPLTGSPSSSLVMNKLNVPGLFHNIVWIL